MLRRLHSIPGLIAALIVSFMAITGAVLSLQPMLDRFTMPTGNAGLSVADLTEKVVAQLPGTERIVRAASGAVTAYTGNEATLIDPKTGDALGTTEPSAFFTFFTELHRSLFLGDGGRIVAGIAAAGMVVLAISGIALLVNRMGGWRRLFSAARGTLSQRLHVELGRMAVVGLLLSAATGIYMTLTLFTIIPDGLNGFGFPPVGGGGTPAEISTLTALQDVPLAQLRELDMPAAGDPQDVFTLVTASGTGYVDQASGELVDFTPNSIAQNIYEAIYALHTGKGLWWLGIILGMASLAVPTMMVTGVVIWARRNMSKPRIAGNAPARTADIIVLVGSEGNTTWGFASTLHAALTAHGHSVHVAPMNALRSHYPAAKHLLVLPATHGNGSAPSSATKFLPQLARFDGSRLDYAVLGFGDRKFQQFCRFAENVEVGLNAHGVQPLLNYATIDRQSSQAFAQWGRALGEALGEELELSHQPELPPTDDYVLIERQEYGVEVQAPTVVLRFARPEVRGWRRWFGGRKAFSAGDLVGIVPPGDAVARFYSIASDAKSGVLEICVRKQSGGLCSEYLFGLHPGDAVQGFVRRNPEFRPAPGRKPVILIGAGTGVAPLMGFVRGNDAMRPMHLFFGGRDPSSDFLYAEDMAQALEDGRLTALNTAFSRVMGGRYVQDRVVAEAEALRQLVKQGGQIVVCGGAAMADGVRAALDTVLAPMGLDVETLRYKGRYAEDVY